MVPSIGTATLIGGVGSLIVVVTVPLLDKFRIGDFVGAISVHLIAQIWGPLAVVLSKSETSLITQIYGILTIRLFSFVASLLIFYVICKTIGLRSSEEDEIQGLNKV